MARRLTPSQLRSQMRQAQQKQQQAIRKVNTAIDKYNRDVQKAVNDYNRDVRAHNSRVRADRARLQTELRRMNSSSTVAVRYEASTSVVRTVEQRFNAVESAVESGRWDDPDNVLDLAEAETADSVASLNRLISADDDPTAEPQATTLTDELNGYRPRVAGSMERSSLCAQPGQS